MDYRCPICQKLLDENDKFRRYCLQTHKHREDTFAFSPFNFERDVQCPVRGCKSSGNIEDGVFIRHIGCTAENPFWNGTKVEIQGSQKDGNRYIDATGRKIVHWQIRAFRSLPSDFHEMWFPAVLLQTAAKEPELNASIIPRGVMIGLAGATKVGKTVCAMQALDREGYITHESKNTIQIQDYIYSQNKEGGGPTILDTLHLRSLMSSNLSGIFLPKGTAPSIGDVKAVFFRQARKKKNKQIASSDAEERPWFKAAFKTVMDATGEILKSPEISSEWYTIAFYDTAGEDNEIEAERVKIVEDAVDKIAVFVDAEHIAGTDDQSSLGLKIATDKIVRLRRDNLDKPLAIVVTKLDKLLELENVTVNESNRVQLFRKLIFASLDSKRRTLKNLLSVKPSEAKRHLNAILDTEPDLPIFYIWHENLPVEGKQYTKQPVSYGLQQFVCWCLGVEWYELSEDITDTA